VTVKELVLFMLDNFELDDDVLCKSVGDRHFISGPVVSVSKEDDIVWVNFEADVIDIYNSDDEKIFSK